MNIELTKEDYEFLKDLQKRLTEQDTDGSAQPVFWGVMEKHEYAVPEGCGAYAKITHDDGAYDLEEALDFVDQNIEYYDEDIRDQWEVVDRESIYDVYWFMKYEMGLEGVEYVDFVKREELSTHTGAFLTKEACKKYIERYGYNHSEPHTYAMTAYRNFEFGRLLDILKNIDFKEYEEED